MKTGIWNLKFRLCENFITLTKTFFKDYTEILKSGWIFRFKKIEQQSFDLHTKEVWSYYGTFHRCLNEKKNPKHSAGHALLC